jgi:hypothetical protein
LQALFFQQHLKATEAGTPVAAGRRGRRILRRRILRGRRLQRQSAAAEQQSGKPLKASFSVGGHAGILLSDPGKVMDSKWIFAAGRGGGF